MGLSVLTYDINIAKKYTLYIKYANISMFEFGRVPICVNIIGSLIFGLF